MGNTIQNRLRGITAEHVLLVGALLLATWMYIEALDFQPVAGQFPRAMAIIIIICSFMLLFRSYLPEPLHTWAAEDVTAFETPDGETESQTSDEGSSDGLTKKSTELFAISIGYVVLAYLVGIVAASPVFVLAYGYLNSMRLTKVVLLAVISLGIPFLFGSLLNIPVDQGALIEFGVT